LNSLECSIIGLTVTSVALQICVSVQEAMVGPLELAGRYGAYAHLLGVNTEEFVEEFEASDSDAFKDVTDDPFTLRFLKYRAKVRLSSRPWRATCLLRAMM
jgi:hypothetical protein